MQGKLDRVLQDLPFDTQPVLTGLTARTNGPTNPKRKSGKRTKEADPDTHEGPADDGRIGVSFSLSLPGRTFSELPEHSFRTNMIVIVRDGKPITPESPAWTARVTRVFKDSISLRSECFTPEIDAHSLFVPGKDQLYSIELAWDDASYKRQSLAVDLLSTDLQPQLSYNASIFTKRTGAAYKKYPEHPLLGTGLRDVILDDRLYAKGATDVPDFVASNQLLYSWVKRYTRSHPIVLEGDPVLDLNRTQIRAIAQSLSSRCALIQGPPGTGKSITIIEALRLLKVHFQVPQPILVCAPTHVAVDQLLARAVKAGLRPLRVGLEDKVSPSAEPYCMLAQVARHPFAEKLEVMSDRIRGLDHQRIGPAATPDEAVDTKFKRVLSSRYFLESLIWADICSNVDVIFSTCLGASVSHVASIDFPIVFIDEAAQCNEASTLVPLMKGSQQLVLIGDHKQLPSIAMSPDATQEGFNISLFERLMVSKRVPFVMRRVRSNRSKRQYDRASLLLANRAR
ncbi:uncharacterized protein L969DRAFT_479270 [Mixia osmundae IAM 14324]|uniref:uncharacterized protein n=1 Tax=Mixia osmundae (strain CBS 9802 / IAM 14324 / JCM 22182 / KY 12970) TaxID=764103 RepID=UPI0004A5472F|nr:uncharacterized protein L969DRAFT_479270 [Mixia osmundae IAM 14324]KEI38715.1 hypothetical protein L969DRAFT_479270 [Mixia osmundae IAM 14324]